MKHGFKRLMMGALCFIMLLMVTGCGNKTAISVADFKTEMENKGYIVQDAISQFSNADYIDQAYIALSSNSAYQIEFYVLSDSDSASSFFNNNKANFENSKSSGAVETFVDVGNNAKYTLSTNGQFKVVSRIDNTMIYLNVPDSYKSTVEDVLKDLGY